MPRAVPAPARPVRRRDRIGQERRPERAHGQPDRLPDVVIWAIDLKRGMELGPGRACIDRLATTPDEAAALLADAVAILEARAAVPRRHRPARMGTGTGHARAGDRHRRVRRAGRRAPRRIGDTDTIARRGRAVAVTLIAATQRPTQKAMGQGAVRSQMDVRICFRVREREMST